MSIVFPVSAKSHLTVAVLIDSGKSVKLTSTCSAELLENESRFCGVVIAQLPPCSTVGEGVDVALGVGVALAVAVGLGVVETVAVGVLVETARPVVGDCACWFNCFSCRHPASKNEKASVNAIAMCLSTSLD